MTTTLRELAKAYLSQEPHVDANAWAYDEVMQRVRGTDVEDGWHVVLALVAAAEGASAANVGAGPLEEFIRLHGDRHVAAIEREAAQNPKFKWCLGCVWLDRNDVPQSLDRIIAASGGAIHPQ